MSNLKKHNHGSVDADNPEWTEEMFKSASFGPAAAARNRGGRPVSKNPKKSTTVRLDAEILEFFKADGKGWQTRMNDVLREYVDNRRS